MADSHLAFVGTYTEDSDSEGIYRYRVDAETGELDLLGTTGGDDNPSFLALHPSGEYLYAANQVMDGAVAAYAVDRETGDLEFLNRVSSEDARPAHISVDATGSYVLAAHYTGGSAAMLPIADDGRVEPVSDLVEHVGSSVNPDRQTEPHPHSINPGPENLVAYVPDLGTDEVVIYEMDLEAGELNETDAAKVHDGAGPRHFDVHPNGRYAYLINELDSTITAFEREAGTGLLSEIESVDTLPGDFDGESYTADIHVHPSGNWVYGSNRGHDSIVAFGIDPDSGRLDLLGHEPTGGEWPRNFALSPEGTFLFAENRDTNDVHVHRIDDETGDLEPTGHVAEVPEPVCMKFLPE